MMKYTARSMLAVGAVAVMQGESVTQTDALQIKVDRMVAKEHGGILPASLKGVSKPRAIKARGAGSSHGLTFAGSVPEELVSAADTSTEDVESAVYGSPKVQTKVAYGSSGETKNENKAPNTPQRPDRFARRGDGPIPTLRLDDDVADVLDVAAIEDHAGQVEPELLAGDE